MKLATKIMDVMSGREIGDRREPWDSIGTVVVFIAIGFIVAAAIAWNAPLFPQEKPPTTNYFSEADELTYLRKRTREQDAYIQEQTKTITKLQAQIDALPQPVLAKLKDHTLTVETRTISGTLEFARAKKKVEPGLLILDMKE